MLPAGSSVVSLRFKAEFRTDLFEHLEVAFEPRARHVHGPVLLARRNDQGAAHEDPDVVLDCLVLQLQLGRELVYVARSCLDAADYSRPVLAAAFAAKEEPEDAAQLRVVLHSARSRTGNILVIGRGDKIWTNGYRSGMAADKNAWTCKWPWRPGSPR